MDSTCRSFVDSKCRRFVDSGRCVCGFGRGAWTTYSCARDPEKIKERFESVDSVLGGGYWYQRGVPEPRRATEKDALGFELYEAESRYCIARVLILGSVPVLHHAGTGTLQSVRLIEARVCAFGYGVPVLQPAYRYIVQLQTAGFLGVFLRL
uniref:Uncharacterized protein n=1 Tax=Ananas comosus var. bracteatus TaxID=296719 RepID=A0A6V7NH19_ANACO|nr:unnamed protein product [Ananas comosus var. bracteatus]